MTNTVQNHSKELITALEWRYATKQFDTKKISADQEKTLLRAISLSASSFGIEPYEVLVVSNPKVREELRKVSWNQSQITDASHLLVFAARTIITEKDIDEFVARIAKTRGVSVESLESYKQMMGGLPKLSPEKALAWTSKQAYIALGNGLTTAALIGLDACPMEGFDAAAYDKILGLTAKGYATAVVMTVGFRSSEDKYAHLKKVRKSEKELFVHV